MARIQVDKLRNMDFQSVYRWTMQFAKWPAVDHPDNEELNLLCESVTLPKLTGSSTEIKIRGHKVKQPGMYDYSGQITLNFVETVDNKILTFLRNWREAVWPTKGEKGALKTADVKANILLSLLNREDEPNYKFELIGCFLEDFDLGTIDGSSNEAMKPSIVLSYDYFKDGVV